MAYQRLETRARATSSGGAAIGGGGGKRAARRRRRLGPLTSGEFLTTPSRERGMRSGAFLSNPERSQALMQAGRRATAERVANIEAARAAGRGAASGMTKARFANLVPVQKQVTRTAESGKTSTFMQTFWIRPADLAAQVEAGDPFAAVETAKGDSGTARRIAQILGYFDYSQAKDVRSRTLAGGGITYDLRTGGSPREGFAVSSGKEHEEVLSRTPTSRDFQRYVSKHREALREPGRMLGVWKDGGKWYFDVSYVDRDRSRALGQARKIGEKAIFDLEKFETIPIGGGA